MIFRLAHAPAIFDVRQCPEAISFDLENPIRMSEWPGSAEERHGLEFHF
jgi:hypothetical protein